jgi:hypothetical protein
MLLLRLTCMSLSLLMSHAQDEVHIATLHPELIAGPCEMSSEHRPRIE